MSDRALSDDQVREIDTCSEAWRHQCEVKFVAAMPTRADRKHYLAGVRKHRGDAAVKRIVADLWELHRWAA